MLSKARYSLWILLAFTFLIVGINRIEAKITVLPSIGGGPWATSDSWLRYLQIEEPSQAIYRAVSELPSGESIMVIGRSRDDGFILTYFLISYLSWPRQVGVIGCGEHGNPPAVVIAPEQEVGSIILINTPVPEQMQAVHLGSRLSVVKSPRKAEWISYCQS